MCYNCICILGKKGVPVHFSTIEQYISRTYAPKMTKGPQPSNGKRVAIVGSGTAGITIAIILARTAIRHGVEDLTCFSITKKVAETMHKYMQSLED